MKLNLRIEHVANIKQLKQKMQPFGSRPIPKIYFQPQTYRPDRTYILIIYTKHLKFSTEKSVLLYEKHCKSSCKSHIYKIQCVFKLYTTLLRSNTNVPALYDLLRFYSFHVIFIRPQNWKNILKNVFHVAWTIPYIWGTFCQASVLYKKKLFWRSLTYI